MEVTGTTAIIVQLQSERDAALAKLEKVREMMRRIASSDNTHEKADEVARWVLENLK